jgi:hypothetical protein
LFFFSSLYPFSPKSLLLIPVRILILKQQAGHCRLLRLLLKLLMLQYRSVKQLGLALEGLPAMQALIALQIVLLIKQLNLTRQPSLDQIHMRRESLEISIAPLTQSLMGMLQIAP